MIDAVAPVPLLAAPLGSYDASGMEAFAGVFNLPRLDRVVSGADAVSGLGAELDRLGVTRAVVVTGRTLGASALLERVIGPVRARCVYTFQEARQHVPSGSVAQLARVADEHRADGLISFGGGSPIDTAKAAVHTLLTAGGSGASSADGGVPHIAIPTTLSAGEFTAVIGVTDEKTRVKRAISDARIAPRTVIMDPVVTLETPEWLWTATGVRALDHAVETLYSVRHHPLSDAVAPRALALLIEHLAPSVARTGPARIAHRLHCQMAAWLGVYGITNAGFGLSHALGHQIGARWGVAHGITSCITLPHAMRFMAGLAPERFRLIAEGMGLPFDAADAESSALRCAERVEAFVAQFALPSRLRDVQVPRGEVEEVAEVVYDIMRRARVVDRPITRGELVSLLAAAY